MNPLLDKLKPYPFARLRALLDGVETKDPSKKLIHLSLGEPKHPSPEFIKQTLRDNLDLLSKYPPSKGLPELRQAIAGWIAQRYGIPAPDADTQILPCQGSREALFSFGQAVVDSTAGDRYVVCPNPFYQIYEGSTLLANAQPYFINSDPELNYGYDWSSVPAEVWQKTDLMFVCSPGNPTGGVLDLDDWRKLFELSDQYGFVIASDECYSEIYFQDKPLGGLEAARKLGRDDYKNLVMFSSLSKRSNLPGMRSGFVAGDAAIIEKYLLYRTYHGCAMGGEHSVASTAAWNDEAHAEENRKLYAAKFAKVHPILASVLDVKMPQASFYLWPRTPISDLDFTKQLFEQENVIVLPGSYLSRDTDRGNPGANHVRIALVATMEECVEAAERIAAFTKNL